MNKDIKKILIVLALYALAGGMFYNFEELWMAENNLSVSTIGTVLSLCALIACSVIFLSSNIIKPHKLKNFLLCLIIIKTITIFALFLLYKTNLNVLIKFLIMVDYAADTEIYACIYPLISMIKKDDKIYAIRGLLYDISYYIGVILVGFLLGKSISIFTFSYNSYLLMTVVLLIISIVVLVFVDMNKYAIKKKESNNNDLLFKLIKQIKSDKISIYYLLFVFFCQVAYYSLMGMILILLVNELSFEPALASTSKLIVGLISVALGALILSKLTLKNDYINIGIKYIGRLLFYLVCIIYLSDVTIVMALLYTILTSSTYTHVTDAPYINRFDNDEQLAFANLKEMISYLARAMGTFLCGIAITYSLRINFIISAINIVVGVTFIYMALHLKNKEVIVYDR